MLSSEESQKLNDLISNSNFYNLKNESLLSTARDMYVYKITIENKGKSQNLVNITDLSSTKELDDLKTFVRIFIINSENFYLFLINMPSLFILPIGLIVNQF
jgi:hypothetical protein